jgi:hypothetical protein
MGWEPTPGRHGLSPARPGRRGGGAGGGPEANDSRDWVPLLAHLRQDLEWFKVLAQLCQESGAFASTRA